MAGSYFVPVTRSVVMCLLLLGCAERPPGAPSLRDLDAAIGSGPWSVPSLGGSAPATPGFPDPDAGVVVPVDGCGARLLVLFDRSGSMEEPWPGADPPAPRWRVAADALAEAIAPLADRLVIGGILFPSGVGEPGFCAPVAPIEAQLPFRGGADFVTAWNATWDTPVVGGSTPIDIAFDRADEALPRDGVLTTVVLLSDGQPTCDGPVSAIDRADAWFGEGIRTYVIGLPGLAEAGILDLVAAAGGTGGHLPVGAPEALTRELEVIAGEAIEQACGAAP